MLYIIVGKSASGKDTVIDKICKEYNLHKVISRTTRQPRYKNENTHIFVTYEQGKQDWDNGDAIVKQYVQNKDRRDIYYVKQEDIIDKDFYILFPTGVKSLYESNIKDYKVLYLKIPFFTRLKRILKRGDSKLGILKRFIYEIFEFYRFKGDLEFKSNDELYEYLKNEIKTNNYI